ncbi:glutamate receptor U1-like [Aricia agestis]|uniref:glutamate receptor U1-like n=1 Tax=Aricia agestis TaxID=91739 RepID=UPI001C209997|nr:glutamate receptor U1-like [Aricia agestis]
MNAVDVYKKLAKELSRMSVKTATLYNSSTSSADVRTLFLVDLESSNLDILQNTRYLRAPFRWLVLSDTDDDRSKFLWDLPLLLDADFVLAERNGNSFNMIELYKPSPNGPTYSQPRGHYNGTLLDTRPSRELYRRRGDVMGHHMVMSHVIQESNATMYHLPRQDRLNLQYDSVAKMAWVVVRLAFEMVNATPGYIFSTRYGYKRNGSWSGMINDLITGQAVIGTNLLMNLERLEVITYTDTISPFQLRFIFRQLPLTDVSNIFTLPFSVNVWIAIIVCAIISSAAFYLNSRLEVSSKEATPLDGNITDAMLVTLSALSNQGSSIAPRSYSGRMILWLVFLSMMLIYFAYSANIVSLLQAPSNAIRTFDQLTNSKLILGAENLDYHYFLFRNNKKLHERIIPQHGKKQLFSVEECARKIKKESYAIHCVLNPMYRRIEQTFLETDKCDLTIIDYLNAFTPGTPVTKESPYLELLRVSIKRIKEAGIYSALDRRYNIPKPRCDGKVAAFSSISLQNVKPVLMLHLLGVVASVVILVMEVVVHRVSLRINHSRRYRME